jgi:hypothetical protein
MMASLLAMLISCFCGLAWWLLTGMLACYFADCMMTKCS